MKTGISTQFPSSFTIDTQLAVILHLFEWLQCLKRNIGHSGKTESESKDGNSHLWNGSVFFWRSPTFYGKWRKKKLNWSKNGERFFHLDLRNILQKFFLPVRKCIEVNLNVNVEKYGRYNLFLRWTSRPRKWLNYCSPVACNIISIVLACRTSSQTQSPLYFFIQTWVPFS